MRRTAVSLLLAAGSLALSWASPTGAVPRKTQRFTRLAGPVTTLAPAEAAGAYLRSNAPALALHDVRLRAATKVRRWRGHRVVRFRQEHEGLPVFGRGALVRLDRAGRVQTVVTFVSGALAVVPLPVVAASEAHREAAALWGRATLGSSEVTLGVLDDGRHGALVWRVDGNVATGRTRTFVDAVSGEPLRSFSLARSAPGRVFRQNPVATPMPEILELGHITGDGTNLNGRAGEVYHYVSGSVEDFANLELNQLATSDGTGFFYNPHPSLLVFDDPFTEVNLYYHLDRIDTWFRDVHEHTPTRNLLVVANYGEGPGQPYDNAFSTQITAATHGLFFGQGSGVDFGYDGDVMYHEFGHYVIDEVSQMGYIDDLFDEQGMHFGPGGINEGLADYFSSTLMDESTNGEYSMGPQGQRNLDNDFRCPDDVFGEPHEDGRIIGGVTWEIRQTLGASNLADALMFGALTMLSPSATFEEFAAMTSDFADAMLADGDLTQGQVDDVNGILAARGMTTCGRSLPLDGGAEQTTHPFGFDWLAAVANSDCETIRVIGVWLPGAFQYRIDVPADAQTLTVRLRQAPDDRLLYRILLRRGAPIEYLVQPVIMGLSVVFPQQFDHELGEFETDDRAVSITVNDDPPLVPGETYYIAVLHQNCPDSEQTISASTSPDLPPPDGGLPDATTDATDTEPKDGCGCRTGGGPAPLPWLALGVLWLGWIRRRRRR